MSLVHLSNFSRVFIKQSHELAELFGYETRNKYEIMDENKIIIGFAAEQSKGFFNFIIRQFLGHFRSFDVIFFTPERTQYMVCHHPFRWYFERIEVNEPSGQKIGAIEKRFSFFSKKFDVQNERGQVIMQVSSPLWRIWSFKFIKRSVVVAQIQKKWSGFLTEVFTDKDMFAIEFQDKNMTEAERKIILGASVFIDLLYFEHKAGS